MTQPPSPLINDNDYNNLPAFDLWDILDIVKTQGAYLKSCPPTPPILCHVNDDEFATKLCRRLEFFVHMLEIRRRRYGDVADEWPPGYTPTEIKEKRKAEVERLFAMMEAPSPPTPSPSNSEGSPNSAPSCHQSRLPASECAAPEPRQGKKRRREDAGEESKRKKSRRVPAKTNRQLQQVPSPDDTAAEPVPST
ncbi:hypothetical protein F4860DRAFT_275006 [Xylaria cubensis]|nr:hypothetical protein F4860DRAFT_275006 [Xylaria cubensis]